MERHEKLYDYLLQNGTRWVSQKEICNNITGYRYHERNNDRAPTIREDMLLINSLPDFNFIVICKDYHFKIATMEEYKEYRNERIRRLKKQVKMIKDIDFKYHRDNRYDLLKEEFYDIFKTND